MKHRSAPSRWLSAAAVVAASAIGLLGLGIVPATAAPATAAPASPTTSASPAAASAATHLPEGFSLTSDAAGDHLRWQAPQAGIGNARVQFFAGARLLGTPKPQADGYRLDLPAGSIGSPLQLQVRAGGRRVDAAGVAAQRRSPGPAQPASTPAALPPAALDPGTPGPYATVTGDYTLPGVRLPDFPEQVEMQAVVVAPQGTSGPAPLVLILHGRHSFCYGGKQNDQYTWPCTGGNRPIPSYRGYLRAQQLLASQGYVTVSISADGINAQDYASDDGGAQARSSLIRLHLAHWADWAGAGRAGAPAIVRQAPVADLSRVLLMGHSRGGEGVNRAAIDSLTPPPSAADGYHGPVRWKIRGTLQLAPTLFGHDPAADVPSVVVLPGCDGDVSDLQGQFTVDGTRGLGSGTALHSAVFVVGADHNFFNSEWTPGLSAAPSNDDWYDQADAVCGTASSTSLRLTPVQQQQVGATYLAAAARLFLACDDRVLALLDGSGVRAPSVSPARVLSHAVGAGRSPLVVPASDLQVGSAGGTKARLCLEVSPTAASCTDPGVYDPVPSFVAFEGLPSEPDRYAVALTWSAGGGQGASLRPSRPVSLIGAQSVAARVIVPANAPATAFDLAVTDVTGRRALLGRVSLAGLPGTSETVGTWAQEVRVPLTAAQRAGLDLSRIASLQVVPCSGSGSGYLLDAWGYRPGTPPVQITPASRIDVGTLSPVNEPDGTVTYQMPVSISGTGSGTVRFYTANYATGTATSTLVSLRPGQQHLSVPLRVQGDNKYSYGGYYVVLAEAVRGTVVGDYVGLLEVADNDPAPTVSVRPLVDSVSEGGSLTWRLTLSTAAAVDLFVPLTFLPPASGAELSTTDMSADWVRNELYADPLPSRPLSAGNYWFPVVPANTTTVDIAAPSLTDTLAEPDEQLRAQVGSLNGAEQPTPPELTGTVHNLP